MTLIRSETRSMTGIDWDDFRYVLAVDAAGSLAGAARALGVNHSTVLRRIGALEKRLGLRLFDRLPTGYVLTAGGQELVDAARRIDETVTALERRIAGQDLRLTGMLRVTTTDTLAASLLPEILAAFRAEHPGIGIELVVSNTMLNLTRRDADVAIRPSLDPPETLIGRRVSSIAFAVYASPAYLSDAPADAKTLDRSAWVTPDDSLADSSVWKWMRATLPYVEVSLRADSLLVLRHAATAGLGLAALPCYLAESWPGLVRVSPPLEAMTTALWVLTHADLRRTARQRVHRVRCQCIRGTARAARGASRLPSLKRLAHSVELTERDSCSPGAELMSGRLPAVVNSKCSRLIERTNPVC